MVSGPAVSIGETAAVQPGSSERLDVRVLDLAAIRRLFHTHARLGSAMAEGERVAALADLSTMAEAVVGRSPVGPFTYDELAAAANGAQGPRVRATPGVAGRDAAAYKLLALGYSARETADVVSGRITQLALDTAQKMMAVGQGRDAAGNYLDTQYKLAIVMPEARRAPPREVRGVSPSRFDAAIDRYANLHRVEAAIVRAIIATESAFNPMARSPAGALGLMQLMPATARELGVNPLVPEQNIEGGVRYFSQLLRMFGGLELALVAYNAGPGFAQRYARGQAALYGETRDYVKRVLSRLGNPR